MTTDDDDDASWRQSRKLILKQLQLNEDAVRDLRDTITATTKDLGDKTDRVAVLLDDKRQKALDTERLRVDQELKDKGEEIKDLEIRLSNQELRSKMWGGVWGAVGGAVAAGVVDLIVNSLLHPHP